MIYNPLSKVTADHLKRSAYLYVRQSTLKQVIENTESTKRQYALRQKALSLGWLSEQIVVIDTDQGQSGVQAADREGFQKLILEVSLGKAGVVMGLEVSRLARNSTDWHRLLELCALSHTLILDEEGVYEPNCYNDRLLLGLKGTLSEAELHILKARLHGGYINKAKRGELKTRLPIGFVYTPSGKVIRDPNQRIQESIYLFFQFFQQLGSGRAVIKAFHERNLTFPRRPITCMERDEVIWGELNQSAVLRLLHNPRYAGIYSFGRTRQVIQTSNRACGLRENVLQEDWVVYMPHAHEGYITQEEYEKNVSRLRENYQACGGLDRRSPPREGSALLQGIVICKNCGKRMTVRYHVRGKQRLPDYICQRDAIERGDGKLCQSIPGAMIDKMIGEILIGMMTPTTLEVALAVQEEVEQQYAQVMHIYQQRVEAARYEADLARRCYRQVDPDNRLVASTLEADWNEKLKTLEQAQMDYQEQQNNKNNYLSEQQKQEVLSLTQNFKGLWYSEDTPDRERKRIVRLLIEDVTLHQNEQITLHIRFKGGTFQTLTFPRGKQCFESLITPPNIVEEVKRLSDKKNYRQIADHLNKQGFVTAHGLTFTHQIIWQICHAYNIKSRYHQLRERGFLTGKELRKLVQEDCLTIRRWREQGTLDYEIIGGNLFLYYPLDDMTIEQLKKQEIKPDVVREIDRLLNEKNNRQIAEYLNEQGFVTAHSTGFTHQIVREICRAYGIKSRYDRLREKGLLTLGEVCDILQRSCATIKNWEKEGKLGYIPINKVCTLYHPLDDTKIAKLITRKTKGI